MGYFNNKMIERLDGANLDEEYQRRKLEAELRKKAQDANADYINDAVDANDYFERLQKGALGINADQTIPSPDARPTLDQFDLPDTVTNDTDNALDVANALKKQNSWDGDTLTNAALQTLNGLGNAQLDTIGGDINESAQQLSMFNTSSPEVMLDTLNSDLITGENGANLTRRLAEFLLSRTPGDLENASTYDSAAKIVQLFQMLNGIK
jgi:hypothetical protein